MYPCPDCGYQVIKETSGSCDIFPVCFLKDDSLQLAFPDLAARANKCSLIDGQRSYDETEICEAALKTIVRAPSISDIKEPGWRRLSPTVGRYLKWNNRHDHELWDKSKNLKALCTYY